MKPATTQTGSFLPRQKVMIRATGWRPIWILQGGATCRVAMPDGIRPYTCGPAALKTR